MISLDIPTQSRSYKVHIGHNILPVVGDVSRQACVGRAAMLVSDTNVMPLYGDSVKASLEAAGFTVFASVIPAGEQSKTLGSFGWILENMAQAGLGRDDLVVALGGGVVGDLSGFAAACYMRGCAVIQVPTSLLAMVDSSVGGKTAIDLSAGKNLAGAFWQPSAVIADVSCLRTLSHDLFRDSLGEVIKYGVLCDPDLFSSLEQTPLSVDDLTRIEKVVTRNIGAKRDIVAADEREAGLRQTLNLGHTIGHAIEAESNYSLGHGSCVAAGLCCMVRANAADGICSAEVASRICELVRVHGLPTGTMVSADVLYQRSLSDKKRHANSINIVAVRDIGNVEVQTISLDDYRRILEVGCA